MNNEVIYLDYAAATPMSRKVREAMEPYWTESFYNPSAPYAPALAVRQAYEDAKSVIARAIGATKDDIVITAGATESIALAFHGTLGHVVVSAIEHPAVLSMVKERDVTIVGVSATGRVDPQDIKAALRDDTQLVSIALANNEIGTIQPLREIAEVVAAERQRRLAAGNTTPLYLHSDASQGVGQVDVHVARLSVDMLTLNAAKMYGPKQVGLLWRASHVRLRPLFVGGGQEAGLRGGTENVAGTVGFSVALHEATSHRAFESKRLFTLREMMQRILTDAFPEAVVSGHRTHRLAGHLSIAFPGIDGERLLFMLETKGVLVATGSACAANKGTRSHVLEAIGLAPEVADGSLRITLGAGSTDVSCRRACEEIIAAVTSEQQRLARIGK